MSSEQPLAAARAHPWHAFDGMRIVEALDGSRLVAARCSCGALPDVAAAIFAACDSCAGVECPRCAGSGDVVDHRALAWRSPTPAELDLL